MQVKHLDSTDEFCPAMKKVIENLNVVNWNSRLRILIMDSTKESQVTKVLQFWSISRAKLW
jgi:hypothetical protein